MTVSATPARLVLRLLGTCMSAAISSGIPAFATETDAETEVRPDSDPVVVNGDTVPPAANGSTIIYGPEFFARYPNAVSVLDLIRRIPAGQAIMDSAGNQSQRGFSGNDDKILIDGKRLSGKSNDSQSALERITVDQVQQIEIIRGSSPDIKVSSQEGVINIVVKPGANNGGAGSWRADVESSRGSKFGFGGYASYGNSLGRLDYLASVERVSKPREFSQSELTLDGVGTPSAFLAETIDHRSTAYRFSGNLIYSFSEATQARLNGLFGLQDMGETTHGDRFDILAMNDRIFAGNSQRIWDFDETEFELGGDFETPLGENATFKLLGLYRREDTESSQGEDFLIEAGTAEDDVLFVNAQTPTEAIGRTSVSWTVNDDHELEIGTEMALNKLDSQLEYFLREDGALVPQDVSGANTTIKETRNESFIIHSWKINDRMTLDTQVFTEYSRISQSAAGFSRARTFFFVKPTVDFRWNLTKSDQLQISLRRRVSQLDFGDFASTPNDDDQVVAGNTDLVPEKYWEIDSSIEHRLPGDGGRLKLRVMYQNYQDRIELIEVSPGISGRGNLGRGTRLHVTIEGSLRMTKLGLPDLIVEPRFTWNRTRIQDPFTGEQRLFNEWNKFWSRIMVRHDLPELGLTYGLDFARHAKWRFNDIDEFIDSPHRNRLDIFMEKKLFGGMTGRLDVLNLANRPEGRDRHLFDDGIAGGIETSRVMRDRRFGRIYKLSLKGSF